MNHREAIEVLLAAILDDATRVSPSLREEAEAHVARCPGCWDVLAVLSAGVSGEPPADAERMKALYRCEAVRDELWLLDGLAPDVARARFPHVVAHLAWCDACRDRYIDIVQVAKAAAAGAYGPPVFGTGPAWREVVDAAGQMVRELVGATLVAIEAGVAVFTQVPPGVVLVPQVINAGPRRGSTRGARRRVARRLRVALAEPDLSAEVTVRSEGGDHLEAVVRVIGPKAREVTVGFHAVAQFATTGDRRTARAGERIVFGGLGPGDYVLDVQSGPTAIIQRMSVSIQAVR